MTNHEDFEGLAAGYAFHALEPEDEQLLAAHLLTCASCARLVADTAALGAAFAGLVTPEPTPPPPADLRARILAAAAAEPREPLEPREPPERNAEPAREAAPVAARPYTGHPSASRPVQRDAGAPGRSPRRLRRSRLLVGAVAAIIGIGVAVPATLAVSGNDKPPSSTSALAQALLKSGAREVTLHSETGSSVAKAVLNDRGVVMVASGLPVNDKSRTTYVLWAADRNGSQTPVATFDVSGGSPVLVSASKLPAEAADISQVAISYESGRKAPVKPSDVVLSGSTA